MNERVIFLCATLTNLTNKSQKETQRTPRSNGAASFICTSQESRPRNL